MGKPPKKGRPPTTGQYVGYAKAKTEAAQSRLLQADARLTEEVTDILSSAVGVYRREGEMADVPISEIGTSIGDAIEAINKVSKLSKGLRGDLAKRLRLPSFTMARRRCRGDSALRAGK